MLQVILDYEAEYAAALAEREEALKKAADEARRQEAAAAAAAFAYAPPIAEPVPSPYEDLGEIDEEAVGGTLLTPPRTHSEHSEGTATFSERRGFVCMRKCLVYCFYHLCLQCPYQLKDDQTMQRVHAAVHTEIGRCRHLIWPSLAVKLPIGILCWYRWCIGQAACSGSRHYGSHHAAGQGAACDAAQHICA